MGAAKPSLIINFLTCQTYPELWDVSSSWVPGRTFLKIFLVVVHQVAEEFLEGNRREQQQIAFHLFFSTKTCGKDGKPRLATRDPCCFVCQSNADQQQMNIWSSHIFLEVLTI